MAIVPKREVATKIGKIVFCVTVNWTLLFKDLSRKITNIYGSVGNVNLYNQLMIGVVAKAAKLAVTIEQFQR